MKYRDIKSELLGNEVKRPRWRRGRQWTDAEIDTSDIPPMSDDFFKEAQQGGYSVADLGKARVRIRWDFIEWMRAKGAPYKSRLSAALREARRRL